MAATQTLVLVPGTNGGKDDWTSAGSPFRVFFIGKGYRCIQFLGWTGDLDGVPGIVGENGKHADWIAGGWAASYLLAAMPYEDRVVIAHSHGGNVMPYACALAGLSIRALITVCTPVRKDMFDTYAAAKPHIGHWTHVYADGWDLWQRAGELFDGAVGWNRTMPAADQNVGLTGISHTKLLTDPPRFPQLQRLIEAALVAEVTP